MILEFGEKILESVKASIDVVGCNTNLGIILLCSPIVEAIYLDNEHKLQQNNLKKVIDRIDLKQTKTIYKAINLANAGGMGLKDKFDLNAKKSSDFTLSEAMNFATIFFCHSYY